MGSPGGPRRVQGCADSIGTGNPDAWQLRSVRSRALASIYPLPLSGRSLVLGSKAGPINGDDVAVMEEPIQHRTGDHLVAAKDRAPFFEWFVRRQDDGAVLVEAADELEEEIGPPRIHGQIAKFIEDQELETADGIEPGAQRVI